MSKLVPNNLRKRWTDEKLAKKRYSCSTFMLYLGVDGDCDELAHHSIYIAKEYEKNLDDIENAHKLTADPSFYVQNACVTDPGQAPKGQTALYVLLPVTHKHPNVDWNKEAPGFRALALKQLEKLGLKNIEKRTRFEKMITPNNWEHDFGIYKGATFNLAHNFGQMLHLRPRNRFEDLEGVYIVGGGTHPGSGLPVIYEGARISTRLMLQDHGYSTEFLDAPMRAPLPAMGVESGNGMETEPAM
jgi:phytoene desaturase